MVGRQKKRSNGFHFKQNAMRKGLQVQQFQCLFPWVLVNFPSSVSRWALRAIKSFVMSTWECIKKHLANLPKWGRRTSTSRSIGFWHCSHTYSQARKGGMGRSAHFRNCNAWPVDNLRMGLFSRTFQIPSLGKALVTNTPISIKKRFGKSELFPENHKRDRQALWVGT